MANVFKNYIAGNVGTSPSTLTCPSGGTITIIGATLANRTASTIKVTAYLSNNLANLTDRAILVPGATLVAIGGDQKVVLESGEAIEFFSDTNASMSVIVSYMLTT